MIPVIRQIRADQAGLLRRCVASPAFRAAQTTDRREAFEPRTPVFVARASEFKRQHQQAALDDAWHGFVRPDGQWHPVAPRRRIRRHMDGDPPLLELTCSDGARPALGSLDHLGHNHEIALSAPTAFALRPATNNAHINVLRGNHLFGLFIDEATGFDLYSPQVDPSRNTKTGRFEFARCGECRHRPANGTAQRHEPRSGLISFGIENEGAAVIVASAVEPAIGQDRQRINAERIRGNAFEADRLPTGVSFLSRPVPQDRAALSIRINLVEIHFRFRHRCPKARVCLAMAECCWSSKWPVRDRANTPCLERRPLEGGAQRLQGNAR